MTQASPSVAAYGHDQPWAVTSDKINAVVSRLVAVASPLRLIAFGSAARGELSAANDLDLLVVEPDVASRYGEIVRLQKALRGILIPVDLVVTSVARYNDRSQIPGTLEFTARTEGRVLHDSLCPPSRGLFSIATA